MTKVSQNIKSKYNMKTYDGTKDTYYWIITAIKKLNLGYKKIDARFLFKIGDVGYDCNSIEEFTECAYCQKGYYLIILQVSSYQTDDDYIYIASSAENELYVSTNNKVTLEKIVKLLKETDMKKQEEITGNTIIQNNYNIENINGDNNSIIQGDNNVQRINEEPKKNSKIKSWIEAILQNLLANWIWIAIPIVLAVVIKLFS